LPGPEETAATAAANELRQRLNAREDATNSSLSEKVRNLALGLIGFFWAVVSADKEPLHGIAISHMRWLMAIAVCAVLSLFCDLLNSLIDHFHTSLLMDELEATDEKPPKRGRVLLRRALGGSVRLSFYAKIAFGSIACVALLLLVPKILTQLKAPVPAEATAKPPSCVQPAATAAAPVLPAAAAPAPQSQPAATTRPSLRLNSTAPIRK